jgi:diadenosine tetraphosphatase ApaH/serine/threonine PP2A family protein phosphatase
MPRQAILSDIHANLVALERALKDCAEQRVDELVCLGDMAGYGPEPIECVDLVRDQFKWTLCGNHDVALFMVHPLGFNRHAREAVAWQRTQLEPRWFTSLAGRRRWSWLQNLHPARQDDQVLYVHASPRDPLTEYVEESDVADLGFGPSQKIVEIFEHIPGLAFCGHSHRPGVIPASLVWIRPAELPDGIYQLAMGEKTLVNVGSVGQPRDQDPRLCYVIYDTGKRTVQFRRVDYDVPAAQARFQRVPQLPERVWARLTEGV